MPVGKATTTTSRYSGKIVTSDPISKTVEVGLKTGGPARVRVYAIPAAFRWPVEGESWTVVQENGTWYLEAFWPDQNAPTNFAQAAPGDLVLTVPTGMIRVMGGPDGTTDFTISKPAEDNSKSSLGFRGELEITATLQGVPTTIVDL